MTYTVEEMFNMPKYTWVKRYAEKFHDGSFIPGQKDAFEGLIKNFHGEETLSSVINYLTGNVLEAGDLFEAGDILSATSPVTASGILEAVNSTAAGLPNGAGLETFAGGLSQLEIAAGAVVIGGIIIIGGLAAGAFTTDDLYSAASTAFSVANYTASAIKVYSATTAIAITAGLGLMATTAAIATVGAVVATGVALEVFSMEQVTQAVKIGATLGTIGSALSLVEIAGIVPIDLLPQTDDLYSAANDLYSAGNDLYSAASSLWDTLPSSSTFYNIFS